MRHGGGGGTAARRPWPVAALARVLLAGLAAVASLVLGSCGAAPAPSSDIPIPSARPSANAVWDVLEPGEPMYGAPFDGAFAEAFDATASGDGFVLVGRYWEDEEKRSGAIWTSPDGLSWARTSEPAELFQNAWPWQVATDGTRVVAIGWRAPWPDNARRGPYVAWVSEDGRAWERHDVEATALGGMYVNGVVGSSLGFVAWGEQADGHTALVRSTDGIEWEAVDYPGAAEADIAAVAPHELGFVAVGKQHRDEVIIGGPSAPARAWWSGDGREWFASSVDGGWSLVGVYPGAAGIYGIGAQECSRCVGPYLAWRSSDLGRSWSRQGDEKWRSPFVAANGTMIASFDWQGDRRISLSADGIDWSTSAAVPAADHDAGLIVGAKGVLILEAELSSDDAGVQVVHTGVVFLRGVRTVP